MVHVNAMQALCRNVLAPGNLDQEGGYLIPLMATPSTSISKGRKCGVPAGQSTHTEVFISCHKWLKINGLRH